ncbi:aBC transporter related protein [Clostridium sp. CAG:575]|nr:aBC transporter related protein [Clostridium sp. CAG:575]
MKKDTKNLIDLLKYYKKYKFLSIGVIVLSLTYAGISLLSPIYEGKMLGFFENFDKINIIKIALFLLILRIIIEIVTNLWSRAVLKLNGKVNFDLKRDMLESLINFEVKNFDNTNSGLFISRLNKDTTELSQLFDDVTDDLSGIILNVSFIIYVLYLNVHLGIFLILNVILVYILTSRKLFYYKRTKQDYKEKDEKIVGLYTDIIRGIREIKDLNLKSVVLKNTNEKQMETIKAEIKSTHTKRTWNRWIAIFQHTLDFIFILLSIYFITNNSLRVSSFLIIFLYKNKVLNLINYISEIREKLADGKVAAARVFDIVAYKVFSQENYGTMTINNIKGNIEFKNVEFQYNSNKLFKNLNFKIEPNKMTAIVGKSGEGKSTILKLISKSYSVDGGKILIDNYNINDLSEKTIKDNISVVSQSPYIFNLSIKDNIKLANPTATNEQIIEVCKKAQIHDIITQMEKGYDTLVGENGVILSGGQKQRIAIARALLKKSKIILLDEATSSLDNNNQEKIKNVIKELSKDHTVIIVAHRLSTIVDSDNIFVVDKHKICASGTHTELMNNCEEYRNLYAIEE